MDGDDPHEGEAGLPPETNARRSRRGLLMVVAVALVAVVRVTIALISGPAAPAGLPEEDPSATFASAMAEGKPAYLLIHSLT